MLARHFYLTSSARHRLIAGTPTRSSTKALWYVALLIAFAGCSNRPGAIRPPNVDADEAAATVVEQLDGDGDGKLAQAEWASSAVIAAVATNYDKNADGLLDSSEIAGGIALWQQAGVGARSVPFRVMLNGAPLVGATVRLVPADFLGDAVKPA